MQALRIVLISGGVGSGKSTLSEALQTQFEFHVLKTKKRILDRYPEAQSERGELQRLGDALDRRTKGTWVRDDLIRYIDDQPEGPLSIVVDAVRIPEQVDAIRRAFGPRVFHVHLKGKESLLAARYLHRTKGGVDKEFRSYKAVRKNPTEHHIDRLEAMADSVIAIDGYTRKDVLIRAASHLGLYGNGQGRVVDVIVGGQFGSEGKGHICSYLAPEYSVLLRVGGPNAGHKVFQSPEPYTHRQLPSGTLFSAAKLLIAPGSVISVDALLKEAADCGVDKQRLCIDPAAMVITESDRKKEEALVNEIGSTGQGVGIAMARRILDRGKLRHTLAKNTPALKPFCKPIAEELERAYARRDRILVEGTQGTGLSLYHGTYPHVTSRDTTVAGCLSEAGIPPSRVRRIIMVCRSYVIRVKSPSGRTSGHMSQEISWEEISKRSGLPLKELKGGELGSVSGKQRRVAEFDWSLLRRATTLNAPTDIALTFADYLDSKNTEARRFEQLTDETIRFAEEIEKVANAPVSLISTRFHWRSIIDRRSW